MKKEFTERRLVKIYLEEEDWKWVELQAQGNVSRWGREKLLGAMPITSGTEESAVHEGRASREKARQANNGEEPKGTPLKPPKGRDMADYANSKSPSTKVKACKHGVAKGYHCWQCQGLAKVNED